jgi:predicted dehydrogenase
MKALNKIEDVDITAICDVSEDTAKRVAEEQKATAYTDYKEMIDKEELDALYIVVPTFAHFDAEILAVQKGIHLFSEKPVAPTMEKALEILEAVKKADVITCVGYQLRYFGFVQQAKKFLTGREVAMAVVARHHGYAKTPWWRVMAQSGGQMVEQTTHQVDMLRYLIGEVDEVHAYYALRAMKDVENFDIPDVYALNMKFNNGALCSLTSACCMEKGGGGSGSTFLLTDSLSMSFGRDGIVVTPEDAAEPGDLPDTGDIDAVFMDAIRRNDSSNILSDYEEGVRSLDISLAANKSAETGKPEPTYFSKH